MGSTGEAVAKLFLILILITLILWLPLYLLWNWLMPEIFGLTEITMWQALGLMLLSSILFKSGSTSKK